MIIHKRLAGVVQHNDGEFAEVQTVGVEGIETDMLLDSIQFYREDTCDTREEFQERFPLGIWVRLSVTTEITKTRTCKPATSGHGRKNLQNS